MRSRDGRSSALVVSPREKRVQAWHHEGQGCAGSDHARDHHNELHVPPPVSLYAINRREEAKFQLRRFTI